MQKIKLEAASIGAHTSLTKNAICHYPQFFKEFPDLKIHVESCDEIMADKLLSFSASSYTRWRDLWDMNWMIEKSDITPATFPLLEYKILDYKTDSQEYKSNLENTIKNIPEFINSNEFLQEMKKMLPVETVETTLLDPNYRLKMISNLSDIHREAFGNIKKPSAHQRLSERNHVGMTFHTDGHNKYTGTPTGGYTMPAVENPSGGRYEAKTIYQALGTQGVDISALQSGNYSIERTCTINAQTTSSGVEIPNAANLNLTCGHVGVNPSGQLQTGYNQPKYADDDYGQTVRIAAVYGNEVVVGVTVPTTFTQAGAGFFKVNWQLNKVNVTFSKISADAKVTDGKSYTVAIKNHIFGTSAELSETGDSVPSVKLTWDAARMAYTTDKALASGKYTVSVDGVAVGKISVKSGEIAYAFISNDTVKREPVLLKDGKKFTERTTDVKGEFDVKHLTTGSYRMVETEAPAGYIENPNVFAFTVDSGGMTEGVIEYTIDVTDDYTKLHVSKRDITNEAEIEGAKLTLKDSDGKVIDSWTSTKEDHVINALAPGKYTLTEERTPHTYDVAESIDLTVEKTGEIQTAVMYDKPISIKGEIDKRQEIADPTRMTASRYFKWSSILPNSNTVRLCNSSDSAGNGLSSRLSASCLRILP